ncbi:AAA family ATPase [Streptacidiphilus sp. MAP5-3]|uniref:ATP-binding protein n=1 Tax=unclassified Streptacidiphilus TaxID=2643834 RepID=UPI003515665D
MQTGFVDRVDEMAHLERLLGGTDGAARCVIIEGETGIGKSALISEFARRTTQRAVAPVACRVAQTRCYAQIGQSLSFYPVADLLHQLVGSGQPQPLPWWRRALRQAGPSAVASAPQVLSAVVPGLGAVWTAGREIVQAAVTTGSVPLDSVMPIQLGAALRVAEAILDLGRAAEPVVLVVDDLQNVDPSSLMVLDRLVRSLEDSQMSVVVTYAPAGAAVDPVAELLDEWVKDRVAVRRSLSGLPADAVAELVRWRHPDAPADLPSRLQELTLGHPMFLSLCLDDWHSDNGDTWKPSESLRKTVEKRLSALAGPDRELLLAAAVQGPVFVSRVVAEACDQPHEPVLERLRWIGTELGLIRPEETPPAWAEGEQADCYRFEHRLVCQALYDLQTGQQKRTRHSRVAHALEVALPGQEPSARHLEVAYHLARGGPEDRAAATDAYTGLARTAALEGLSFVEAEEHCSRAIELARALPEGDFSRDRKLIAAIELLLSLTEVRWRGNHQPAGGPDIDALAAEAEQAAQRCGDPALLARTALLRGKTLMATRGLVPSLNKLREAVERAEAAGESVAVYVAKVEYGRQLSKRDLGAGLALLREVEHMYATDPALGSGNDPVLQHARNLAQMQLAISLYDTGHLSEALGRLEACASRLRETAPSTELPIALNYLAQVHTTMGAPEKARLALAEAREIEERRGGPSGWHAYNTALLAQLLSAELEERAEGLELIEAAWRETEETWLLNLVPIVRNLYAQTLLDQAPQAVPREADELLAQSEKLAQDTCVETRQTGMVRSEIAARILLSRVHRERGQLGEAVAHADGALDLLDSVGDMPALRTEEVFYYAAVAHGAAGNLERAQGLIDRARTEVLRKADGVDGDQARETFLHTSLNDAILKGIGIQPSC